SATASLILSQVCQNFHLDCEAAVNRMVNLELYASYVYLSMVSSTCISSRKSLLCSGLSCKLNARYDGN
uniref:ferroxidase n=1 Tax=Gopherus evgoodei TaxID=1825980 RepID=A0A8C4WIX2_9SAUR